MYSNMIQTERYQQTLSALSLYHGLSQVDETTRWLLLDEHFSTQRALKRFGITEHVLPSAIPHIGEVLPPTVQLPEQQSNRIIFDVIGMPNTGKTTLCTQFRQDHRCYLIPEQTKTAKRLVRQAHSPQEVLSTQLRKETLYEEETFEIVYAVSHRELPWAPIISDRSVVDNRIFSRAFFLTGQLPLSQKTGNFLLDVRKKLDYMVHGGQMIWIEIVCLLSPQESYRREEQQNRDGRIMNIKFLEVLYEQYLRFHAESLFSPRSYWYVCLDMTNTSQEENQRLFEATIEEILYQISYKDT
jgi:hypothetical protein